MTLLDYALKYAALGAAVFPVHSVANGKCTCGKDCEQPGKHPRIKGWQHDATTDSEQIEKWWTSWPNSNIAWALPENIVVVDVDVKHDMGKYGDETLNEWENQHGSLYGTVL